MLSCSIFVFKCRTLIRACVRFVCGALSGSLSFSPVITLSHKQTHTHILAHTRSLVCPLSLSLCLLSLALSLALALALSLSPPSPPCFAVSFSFSCLSLQHAHKHTNVCAYTHIYQHTHERRKPTQPRWGIYINIYNIYIYIHTPKKIRIYVEEKYMYICTQAR